MKKLIIVLWIITTSPSWASIPVSNYAQTTGEPTEEQLNPIRTVATFEFPREIEKVGEAINIVLAQAGYSSNLEEPEARDAYVLFNFSLPAIHRTIGPMTIENILRSLAGPSYQVEINQLYRTVSFNASEPISEEVVLNEMKRWQQYVQRTIASPIISEYSDDVIRVEKGDSLYTIGMRLHVADMDHFVSQVFEANREAFMNDDINLLREGVVLQIPAGANL